MENSQITSKIEPRPIEPLKFTGLRIDIRLCDNKDSQNREFDKAFKIFKKKVDKDGILFEVKDRRYYIKPSQKLREEAKKRNKRR